MNSIVEINGLTKVFKGQKVVDGVSFTIKKGEVVAILGPNGAGKTTTISMLLGLLKPTSGESSVLHGSAKDKSVREKMGVMLQEVSLMDGLKVKELLQLFQSYYPNPLSIEQLTNITGITEEELSKRTEKLSGGQKRKVSFALALCGNPELIFIDEPTVGMDISTRRLFWKTIQELACEGKTIIFTTHYLQEADDFADRIILFNKGKVIADGKNSEIKKQLTQQTISFVAHHSIPKKMFLEKSYITNITEKQGRTIIVTDNTDLVLEMIFKHQLQVSDIQIEKGSLDDVFEFLVQQPEVSVS